MAAPPAVQALVAGETSRAERTRALTLLASAFGLGTIAGPAIAPYLVLGHAGAVEIGLAGPAFASALFGVGVFVAVRCMLPDDRAAGRRGAPAAYPSIGGQGEAEAPGEEGSGERVGWLDRRVRPWLVAGLVMGHAQGMTGR